MSKKRKALTKGERVVWAAAFVRELSIRLENRPHWAHGKIDFEVNQACSATETAWAIVEYLRDVKQYVIDGFGEDDEVYKMYKDMTR